MAKYTDQQTGRSAPSSTISPPLAQETVSEDKLTNSERPACYNRPSPSPVIPASTNRLIVCPRLDHDERDKPLLVDNLLDKYQQLEPMVFDTEEQAREYSQTYVADYAEPVSGSSFLERMKRGNDLYTGLRFSEYAGMPTEDELASKVRFFLDLYVPVQCVLQEDWGFSDMQLAAYDKPARMGHHSPWNELLEVVYELEDALYRKHQRLTRQALKDFFSSFQLHKHLKLHAIKMLGYYAARDGGTRSVWSSLILVRKHILLYINEELGGTPLHARRDSPADVIGNALRDNNWTINTLSEHSVYTTKDTQKSVCVSKNTIKKIQQGKRVNQAALSAVADALKVDYHSLLPR